MYANQYGPANPPPGFSNNPFIDDPTTAHARFPDLSSPAFQPGYPHTAGYPNQPAQYQQQYQTYPSRSYAGPGSPPYQAQPQVMSPQSQYASTSLASQYPGAQGQMGSQPTGISGFQSTTGYTQQYPISSGYPYSNGPYPPQPSAGPPSYLSEFDPYAQTASQPQSQSHMSSTQPQGTSGSGTNGIAHPRDLIRTHKSGLEAWDTYSWKQLLSACDALKEAWSARKQQAESVVRQYGGADPGLFGPDPAFGYGNHSQVEGWRQVLKDANNNFDTVAASTFQLYEVFNSYRHSGDQASKRRVRESCNAAIKGLPDWPSD